MLDLHASIGEPGKHVMHVLTHVFQTRSNLDVFHLEASVVMVGIPVRVPGLVGVIIPIKILQNHLLVTVVT